MREPKQGDVIAVWFSRGAASAVAAKKTIEKYGNRCVIRILTNPVYEEDGDNYRFQNDVEKWLGVPIENVVNNKYPNGLATEVWEKRGYMSGIHGAPCTAILKREAREQWEKLNKTDWIVLGFTVEETDRHEDFVESNKQNVLPVLIDSNISKNDCYAIVKAAGLTLPRVYSMASKFGDGMPNANCVGCVKATSPTYWNHVRSVFPDIFESRCVQSRRLGVKLVRYQGERIFLDELPADAKGQSMKTMSGAECGTFCEKLYNEGIKS